MSQLVVMGAMMQCSFGVTPSALSVLPKGKLTNANKMLAATIMDNAPMVNIAPFGMCTSLANPTVASATSAASGVLTPMPCIPVTTAPWAPGSPTVMVGGTPALNTTSKLMCTWAGVISITTPGQFIVNVP
ncbi:MAG TPA: DUF4280 domain-containing protein [Chloroflexia bacterium]|nr:DUF4280 domain-containing protein [Chloroflexia bacterium]